MTKVRRIFISYSHNDVQFRQELEKHLTPLLLLERVESWSDKRIQGGQAILRKVAENIQTADIVLLLISADYFASSSCMDEMQIALGRTQEGNAVAIPVIIRPCDWQILSLGAVLGVPKDGKPVSTWADRDAAWTNVVISIRSLVDEWEIVAKPTEDQQPAESVEVISDPVSIDKDQTQVETQTLKSNKWVFRKENLDNEWDETKNGILSYLTSLAETHASTGININGRWWGTKILIDVTFPGMQNYRRIWLEDVGGNPGYPGYQLSIAGDDRLGLKRERLRWLTMQDGSKLLMSPNRTPQEAFTPEAYAGHLWTLIKGLDRTS